MPMAYGMHDVVAMRRELLILFFAVLTAITGPLALHFYNKSSGLEDDLRQVQARMRACTNGHGIDSPPSSN